MFVKRLNLRAVVALIVLMGSVHQIARAGDVTLTLPKRSQLTPVQRLNREGVEAVRKQQYEKAETLFYKAYLYDPGDPFFHFARSFVGEG